MTRRLNDRVRAALPPDVAGADYDRQQPAGIVHIGVGAFHRGHQAAYFDRLLAGGERGWMIRGVSLRNPTVSRQLNPQEGLYTLVVRDGQAETARVIGSIRDVLVAPDDPSAVIAALAAPDTQLVTLTVTEKGYCLDSATGALNFDHPDIQADLAAPESPRSAPGYLVAGLRARREAGLGPFTVLSCDNLFHNGAVTRRAVLELAERFDPGLAAWIARDGAFPSSMVDRIVPATTDDDINQLELTWDYRDEAMVKTEPFTQWVVEDRFCARRPPLESVGVQMTQDVSGWEKAKLRMLNGAHSAMAYLGSLAGHAFIHDAIHADGFEALVNKLWDETQVTLDPAEGFDPAAYRAELLSRFRNPSLRHRTYQIAMDGSQKLPPRLVAPILTRDAQGMRSPAMILAVAAWMRWQFGEDESGRPCEVQDPLASRTRAVVDGCGRDPEAVVAGLLAIEEVFDPRFRDNGMISAELTVALRRLLERGAAQTVLDTVG